MREDDSYAGLGDTADLDLLSPSSVSEVKNLTDLWSLARAVADTKGDPVWDALYSLNCDPKPLGHYGYSLHYCGYDGVYFPKKADGESMKFALVRLPYACDSDVQSIITRANSLSADAKFSLMGAEVWITCECGISPHEKPGAFVFRILQSLKSGAEMFKFISDQACTFA